MSLTSPPLISGVIKLTPISRVKLANAYDYGFISIRTAEPSFGLPSGVTNTLGVSAYFFPIFGLGTTYRDSRKFTGYDTLILRNNKLGYNNRFPTFSVDISGSLRTTTAVFNDLSTTKIVQSSVSNPNLEIEVPGQVIISNNLRVQGTTVAQNLTATNIVVSGLTAQNRFEENTIATIYTLTAAEIGGNFNVQGRLSADDVDVKNSLLTLRLTANDILTQSLTAVNLNVGNNFTIAGNLSASGSIFGQINIDPTAALRYNTNNQLQYAGNLDYVFIVCPSDKFSTDDPFRVRRRNDTTAYDTDIIHPGSTTSIGAFAPFFKTLQGVFDYIDASGIFGRTVSIRVYGNHIYGEQRPVVRMGSGVGAELRDITFSGNTPQTPAGGTAFYTQRPNGGSNYVGNGDYSTLRSVNGNINSRFYSSEWIQANWPALYNAGIRGGEFIWSSDGAPIVGEIAQLNVPNINFRNVQIFGTCNIGTSANRYTPEDTQIRAIVDNNFQDPFYGGLENYWPTYQTTGFSGKIFNFPPPTLTHRVYVCSDPSKILGDFSGTTATTWTQMNTNYGITFKPIIFDAAVSTTFDIRDVSFEFDTNANFTEGYHVENAYQVLRGVSIACLGESIYTKGALWLNSSTARLVVPGDDSEIEPGFLYQWEKSSMSQWAPINYANSSILSENQGDGALWPSRAILPRHGLAFIGNPSNRSRPTVVWNVDNKLTGIITLAEGAEFRNVNYGANSRRIGDDNQNDIQIILAGRWNAPSMFHLENNAFCYTSDQTLVDRGISRGARGPRTLNSQYGNNVTWAFGLSCRNIKYNNIPVVGQPTPSYRLEIYDDPSISNRYHFQYIQFRGAFSYLGYLQDRGLREWQYVPAGSTRIIQSANSTMVSINNPLGADVPGYVFFDSDAQVDMSRSVIALGSLNHIEARGGAVNGVVKVNANRSIRVATVAGMQDAASYSGYGAIPSPINPSLGTWYRDYYRESQR